MTFPDAQNPATLKNKMNNIPFECGTADYHGFEQKVFEYKGHTANIIIPSSPKENPKFFVWRVEFLGAFDTYDTEMVRRGYYLVNYEIHDMFGCPESVELMKSFFDFCKDTLSLAEKCIPVGFSRGGLYSFNFALKYPECVHAVYLDAPVLDLRSWPGGMWEGFGSEHDTVLCKNIFHLSDTDFSENTRKISPVDRIDGFTGRKLPLALVAGDSDACVPYKENGIFLENAYREKGLPLLCIIKKGCDHHPHSLDDPTEICNFTENA